MSRPTVLMYHGFGVRDDHDDPHRVFVAPEQFAAQLAALRARGAAFLDLDGWLAGLHSGRWPRRSVLLTIDDGYVSTLTEAAPLLAAAGAPAVLFALGGRVGGHSDWMADMPDEPLLDADGLRALAGHGIEVGVHGWDHVLLPGLEPAQLQRQVVDARDALADVLGRVPRAFAHPSGQHDLAARTAVRDAGYAVGFAVHVPDGVHAVQRTDVNPTDTALTFRLKTTGWWPVAHRAASWAPPLRRAVHAAVGSARAGRP